MSENRENKHEGVPRRVASKKPFGKMDAKKWRLVGRVLGTLLLICVPIFVPIAKVFGWNLIWFGVIITVLDNMASITPPFGISLFVMKEVAGVTLGAMYRSAVPFVIALFVCLLLIVLFPSLATYLPTLMNG